MVRNMPFSVTEDQLHETFAKFGEVLRVKVPLGQDGRPRGFGFVDFADASAAEAALSLDQSDFDGRSITVQMATPREPRQQQQDRGGGQNKQWQARNQHLAGQTPLLFFGGLSYNATEESIKEAVGYDDVARVCLCLLVICLF
jgi:RNA recognition motif-containing protein